jgi:hypothetical protein
MAIGYSLNVQRIPDGVTREARGAEPSPEIGTDTDSDEATVRDKPVVALAAAAAMPDLRSRFAGLSSRLNR